MGMSIVDEFIAGLREVIASSALATPTLFDSFKYTTTGNNLCHSRALGWMAKAAWKLPFAAAVEIDVRFNLGGGVKFQPDLAVRNHEDVVQLVVDFESPNSSDARIPTKDVAPYLAWAAKKPVEYLI